MRHDAHGYWLSEAPIGEPLPAAEGAIDCDFLVVGGGYTGMWAAWRLAELEPDADVVLIEADLCGRGPSGRNARLAVVEPQPERVPGGLAGWAGGNAIRAGMLAKEAAEEEERVAHAIHRGLASIPERIGFNIGR